MIFLCGQEGKHHFGSWHNTNEFLRFYYFCSLLFECEIPLGHHRFLKIKRIKMNTHNRPLSFEYSISIRVRKGQDLSIETWWGKWKRRIQKTTCTKVWIQLRSFWISMLLINIAKLLRVLRKLEFYSKFSVA